MVTSSQPKKRKILALRVKVLYNVCFVRPIQPICTGVLELTHNHGTESDPSFTGYVSGNTEPGRGFGHLAISVDNIEAACERFEKLGVPFKKKLTDGKMKNIAFILDPDG